MGLESKRNDTIEDTSGEKFPIQHQEIADGALSTLSSVIRITGDESFPLGGRIDDALFPRVCADFARHVENGAAVPDFDIERGDGRREWSVVQRFFVDRRRQEKQFVTERLTGYRDIVNDLVSGLREIGRRDDSTAANVRECLASLQEAIGVDEIPQIQAALTDTIGKMNDIFVEQKRSYETQLNELNDRMSNLRSDLVTAREEMKRDALTQAFNRGAFDSFVAQSLNMHYISRQPVTLLMIDLDDFKQVNDQHGHGAGDAVLRAIGDCLARSFIRKNDLIARYGGDEFAVILADTAGKHVVSLAERFLDRVRSVAIDVNGKTVAISCSVGFTEALEGDTVETFVNRADEALYRAKSQGRDRSVHILPKTGS